MMRAKNKSTSPNHTFPIALKLSKSNNKAEKNRSALGRFRTKVELIPRGFTRTPWLIFRKFDHLGHVEDNLHRVEYGN